MVRSQVLVDLAAALQKLVDFLLVAVKELSSSYHNGYT